MNIRKLFWLLLALCAAGLGLLLCPGCKPKPEAKAPPRPPIKAPDRPVLQDPVQRGKMIFSGAEYSKTGLTCAACHSASKAMDEGRIFIAHSAYGAAARGAWYISTQAEFDAKQGQALTLADAANKCITAPYMGGEKLLEGDDAKALEAFFATISDTTAKDSAPFIQQPPFALPPAGLKPDKANGLRVYEQSCSHCHGMVNGIPKLPEIKAEFNTVQLMGKLRRQPNWEDGNKDAKYVVQAWPFMRLARALGLGAAYAQEPPAEGSIPPPAPGMAPPVAAADAQAGAEEHADGRIFPEDSMPYFATDILSDQDVVDVAFYIVEDLGAE